MFSYIARQPILDKDKAIYGYELLFRNGMNNAFPNISDEEATSRLIVEQQFDRDIKAMIHNTLGFINFSRQSLIDELPELLPKDSIVVEVLETVQPDEEVINVCHALKNQGYVLALDDYDFNPAWHQWLHLFQIVKVDISEFSPDQLKVLLQQHDYSAVRLLAERVETQQELDYCLGLGFSLFQGYFFAKPQIVRKQALPANQLAMLQLLALLSKKDFEFDELEAVISMDPGLSFKLLRFLNSAYFGIGNRISSIKQALVYLGQREITRFVALISVSSLGGNNLKAVISQATFRGFFCESAATLIPHSDISNAAFLTGLLSMLDTLLEDRLETLLTLVPVDISISQALLEGKGVGAKLLQLAKYYETADWQNITAYSQDLGLDEDVLNQCYLEASDKASRILSEL